MGKKTGEDVFRAGQRVKFTEKVGIAVVGSRGTVISVHPKPVLSDDAWLSSRISASGTDVADVRLQTGVIVPNVPLNKICTSS